MTWGRLRFANTRLYGTACLLGMCWLMFSGAVPAASPSRELVILNWSEYMDPALIEGFEQAHQVKIKHIYYESDDHRDQLMAQTRGRGMDLILVNGPVIESYRRQGWLQPLPEAQMPNLKLIEPRWQQAFDSAPGYCVPYAWGTLGIAYRADLVKEPITRWRQFFQPAAELHGKILMVNSSRDVIGMALKTLGYSLNSEDPEQLKEAEALLLGQRPAVAQYGYFNLNETSSLVKGSIVAAMAYNGDALSLQEHDENIRYVLPEEGGNIWVDHFCIAGHASDPGLAAAFIDYINEPQRAAHNAEALYQATPNRAAEKLLPAEILADPAIYPDEQALASSEFYGKLSPRGLRRRAAIFARIKK